MAWLDELNDLLKLKQPLTQQQEDYYTNLLFSFYREHGYPNYPKPNDMQKVFSKIASMDCNKYYDDTNKILKKYQSLNGALFSFFPHWINIRCGNNLSLKECWEDDDKLEIAIRKTLRWLPKHNEVWTDNRIRQNAKVFCSGQTVSNFNPVASKYLYQTYGNKGIILDMSSGWGGRMLGFIGSDCKKYIGYEPSSLTYKGLNTIKQEYYKCIDGHKTIELHKTGSEEMQLKPNSIDFAFTSPPYFDCEKYSNENTQSYIKFSTQNTWSEGFLGETFKRVYQALKPNSYMAINIANTKEHQWIEEACVNQAEKQGFILTDTLHYELSGVSGKGNKLEPVFIFQKKE